MTRLRARWRWLLAAAVLAGGGAILNLWLVSSLQYRSSLRKEGFVDEMVAPGPSDRILIIAPHPDDEMIGCGGLIQQALANGAGVRVVLMTNGDGSELSLIFGEHDLPLGPAAYVKLGAQRQQESLAALRQIGLSPRHVEFLGYPNNGLLDIWQLEHWGTDHLYRSPNTRASRSPYESTLTPGAPYCGQQVLADLIRVMLETRPTAIFVTHPNDVHPDHWVTDAFTRFALATLIAEGSDWARQTAVYGYLVHWPGYPAPRRLLPKLGLLPPSSLLQIDAGWHKLPLTPDQTSRKLRAIRSYRSQVPNLDRLLLAFARSNEMFATLLPATMRAGEVRWPDEAASIHHLGGADITGLELRATDPVSAEITTRRARIPGGGEVALDLRGWDERGAPLGTTVYVTSKGARAVRMAASSHFHPTPVTVDRPELGRLRIGGLPWPGGAAEHAAFVTCWGKTKGHLTDPAVVSTVTTAPP